MVSSCLGWPQELAVYETFNEKLLYLPYSFTAAGYDGHQTVARVTRQQANLPGHDLDAPFVLCSFNRLEKLDPLTYRLWIAMAQRVPGSLLWILETEGPNSLARANLQAEAAALGFSTQRLIFADRVPKAEHLGRMALADIFLDSAQYSAHTIAADALWAGLPILACPTDTYSSRVSASMLVGAGLADVPLSRVSPDELSDDSVRADAGATQARKRPALRVPLVAASWKEYSDSSSVRSVCFMLTA